MKHSTFFWFFLPTGLAMLLFIALPLVSVVLQSVHTPHEAVLMTVESCGPFGCKQETSIDQDATAELRQAEPLGRFVGLDGRFSGGADTAHAVFDLDNHAELFFSVIGLEVCFQCLGVWDGHHCGFCGSRAEAYG